MNEKSLRNLKSFKKGQSGNPAGSNPKWEQYTYIRNNWEALGFRKSPSNYMIRNYLRDIMIISILVTTKQARAIIEDDTAPVILKGMLNELATTRRGLDCYIKMYQSLFGKNRKVDIDQWSTALKNVTITPQEAREHIRWLEEEYC